jgi:hypothetical protein
MGEVIHLRGSKQERLEPAGSTARSGEIVGAVTAIGETLRRIERNDSREHELHVLSTDLLHLLALVEREPQVERASDRLYEAARLFVLHSRSGGASDAEYLPKVRAAYRHLRMALTKAEPREVEFCK